MKPIAEYTLVERNQIVRLRGVDNQQNNTGILYRPPTAGTVNITGSASPDNLTRGPGGGVGESLLMGIGMGNFALWNSSGGTITVGIGVRIPNVLWGAGQWVNANTTSYTDDTADAQSAAGGGFAAETTTNNDGIAIHSRVPFNLVSFDVGTAGDAATRVARYSNSAGNGWTDIGTNILADAWTATGERIWFYHTPPDWGTTQNPDLAGVPGGRYALNLRATVAPAATAALMDSLSIYRMYFINEALANNAFYTRDFGSMEAVMSPGDALVAYFGTADNLNAVQAMVRPRV